ncbi:MAG: DUF4231 domain-containing protein [Chloroflexi bacterium]|nr:DUF4231 domain-containing protein [Chloroflexota bacterium]
MSRSSKKINQKIRDIDCGQFGENLDKYVLCRYNKSIKYYWRSSRRNKQYYKITQGTILVLGALITFISSISIATKNSSYEFLDLAFSITTPILAAILSVTAGFSQTFQWGSAWQDMVIMAEKLEKERDRFLLTPPDKREPLQEMALLNNLVIEESYSFFGRILGSATNSNNNGHAIPVQNGNLG